MKERFRILLALFAMMLIPNMAWAQEPTFSGGSGSDTDPYIIRDATDLLNLSMAVNDGTLDTEGKFFQLPYEEGYVGFSWTFSDPITPIGTSDHPFKGTFDGQGSNISGLTTNINDVTGNNGLFGVIDGGTVKNLGVNQGSFTGGKNAGGIVGYLKDGLITYCTVSGTNVTTGDGQSVNAGGIAGLVGKGTISNCTVTGGFILGNSNFTGEGNCFSYTGGIAGCILGEGQSTTTVSIESCKVNGSLTIESLHSQGTRIYAGGIIGFLGLNVSPTISGNTVKGSAVISVGEATNRYCGAIAGEIGADGQTSAFTDNTYEYTVNVDYQNGSLKEGYVQRGFGNRNDITTNNGAILSNTKTLTISNNINSEFEYYAPLSDTTEGTYALAAGSMVNISLYPEDGEYPSSVSLVYTPNGGTEQNEDLDNITESGGYEYAFEMPAVNAVLNVTLDDLVDYGVTVGGVAVTNANADNIISSDIDGNVTYDADTHTLTLETTTINMAGTNTTGKNAIESSLANLTVYLVGNNAIICQGSHDNVFKGTASGAKVTFDTNTSVFGNLTITASSEESFFRDIEAVYKDDLLYAAEAYYDYDEENYTSTIEATKYFSIGGEDITAENYNTELNELIVSGSASFTPSTNTLTLNGATIERLSIAENNTQDFNIEISGSNFVRDAILGHANSALLIKQASGATTPSFNITGEGEGGPVGDFKSVTLGEGLYLTEANNSEGNPVEGAYYNGTKFITPASNDITITNLMISTTEPTIANSIWVNGIQVENDGTFEGLDHVTYNADTHTLTLDGASAQDGMLSLSTTDVHPEPMIVCNGDLIVQLTGNNSVSFNGDYSNYVFKNIGSSGTLTITQSGTDATMSITTEYSDGDSKGLCNGFSAVNFAGGLAYRVRSGSRTISTLDLASPDFYVVNPDENEYSFQLTNGLLYGTSNGAIVGAEYFYKITYADSSIEGSGVEHKLTLDNTSYNIDASQKIHVDNLEPCTIEAYTKLNGETSAANKAKKFGPAEETMRLVYGADPVDLVLAPAIEESDGISILGIEANVTYNTETGKVSSTVLGTTGGAVAMTTTLGKTLVLNNYFTMDFEVVPPVPTISLAAGTYLNTEDPIEVTGSGLANTTIKYRWDEGTAADYPAGGISLQTGTLTAWEEHTAEGTTVSSDVTSVAYTVKTDISDYYVALDEEVTYSGEAITPTITVKPAEQAETVLEAETDYTVSYQKEVTKGTYTDVTSMTEAGNYQIIITGTGNYGGEIVNDFTITKADFANVTIGTIDDQLFTGNEIKPAVTVTFNDEALSTDEYEISYSNNTNAGTATVTLTSKGKNFTTTNTRTATFTINPPAPTISPDPDDGPFNIGQQVTMTVPEALENATIKYVLGNDLTVAATTYTEPFALNENTTVNAWVEVTDEEEVYRSETVTANYTLKQDPKLKVKNIWQRVRMGETFSQEVQSEVLTTTPTVTWSSSNEAVAIVDATTGVVTPVAPSSTDVEITATFAGDDTYSSATVSYAVSVQKGEDYLWVKDGDDFVAEVRITKGNSLNINETYQVICPAEIAGSLTWTPDDETIVSAEDGVISAVGCGNTRIVVAFAGNSNYEADTYEFYVNAAPLAPTIGLAAGSYLSTHDPITITKEDIANTTISYTWDDITGNNDATWINYTDDGVVFREGTLSARVGYIPEGGGDIVFSDTVSVAYTELIDIATCTVTGNENQTYNGSAYTPALTVTPAGGGTALTLDTDYTVSYKKGDAAVESMIDAATYTIVITAKDGSAYGGSKEVDFTIDQLDITDATVTLSNTELTFIPGDNGQGVEQSVTVSKITSGSMQIAGGGLNSYFDITGNTQTAVGTYTVTVTAKTDVANNYKGSATATFTIVNRTVTAADMGIAEDQTYGTYYSETEDLTLPEGLVAYVITGVSGTTVTTKRISNIPKGVAVLVEKGTSTESAAEATGNLLHGTTVDTDVSSIEGGSVYVLYQGEFVKTTSGTIPANRCYLLLSDTAAGARRLTISHGDNTGIDNVMQDENGDERWYDLQGRRIEAPTKKGLYIRNGKTVVINKK